MIMKRNFKITCLVLLVSTSLMLLSSCGKDIVLSEKYVIVVSQNATETEKKAADEFSRLLALSTPVTLSVVTDNQAPASYEIVIGNTNRDIPSATDDLQTDGFTVQTAGDKLFIRGGTKKGCLYGVYEFFENYLGYRCYSPTVFTYPRLDRVKVASGIRDTQIPFNVYRRIFYHVTKDVFYADWHRLHQDSEWGTWCHTFQMYIPPDTYGKDYPEYFALVNGNRPARQVEHHELASQLCLSNPNVLRLVIEELEKRMKDNPTANYWSVSQNDTYEEYPYNCTCDQCAALDKESGSPSGSLITFVNKVAKHFPDKIISTLAYRYSRTAPVAVNPDTNVNIMLCSIECNRNIPIVNDTANVSFCRDVEGWSAKTNNILMWDYVIQFANLLSPFPNLRTLQPNIQYFVRNNVTAHFQQGNISKGGEFSELRPYLIAKLLWNPDVDIQSVMDDFLNGYYEDAAPYVALYINLMHDELEKSKIPLTIYGHPYDHFENGFLRLELAEQYEQFFDKAEQAVKDKPDVLKRVQIARLPLTFSLFEIAKKRGYEETRVFENVNGTWQPRSEIMDKLDSFIKLSKQEVQHLCEGWFSPEQYGEKTRTFMMVN